MSSAPPSPTPGVVLARYAVAQRTRQLAPAVLTKLKLHILDTLAAVVSGSALEAGIAGRTYVRSRPGVSNGATASGEASILGTGLRCGAIDAAFANGMSAHADESDDSHETSQTHPGGSVLPAALAVAQLVKATGDDFVRAVGLAYEVCIRFGEALAPHLSFARSSLSCHAIGPLFGAGFAAGYLLGFDEAQFLVLLNYLAQEASGLTTWRLDQAHTLKSYNFAAMPNSNAVKCALLVHSGFTGAGDVLGDDRNFFDALLPGKHARLDLSDLHKDRLLDCDIKKYSVGFPIASPLAALEAILARLSLGKEAAERIKSITVHYHPDWYRVIGDANKMPDLNLRHCLAATVVEGHLSFEASHEPRLMLDPQIVAVGTKVRLLEDTEQDKFTARVEVELQDGSLHQAEQDRNVLGRYENPMSAQQVEAKATELLSTVLSEATTAKVVEMARTLETEGSIESLVELMAIQ